MKITFSFLILFLTVVACNKKKETIYKHVFENTTGNSITLRVYQDSGSFIAFSADSIVIPANEEYVLFSRTTTEYKTDYFNPCKVYMDSVVSRVSGDTLTLTKPILDSTKWIFSVTKQGKKGKGECECRFSIKSTDLQ